MVGGFTIDPGALWTLAARLFDESATLGQAARRLAGAGAAKTGDGGLDGLIARLTYELTASVGGAGMSLEDGGRGLLTNRENYLAADQASSASSFLSPFSGGL